MASPKTAPPFADDEMFDFDGETCNENGMTGVKREFADLDDDEEELYPSKKIYASHGPSSDHATTTILNLRSTLEDRDSTIATLKASLDAANGELDKWKNSFINDSLFPAGTTADPAVVTQAMQKLQTTESQLKEQLLTAKRRESVLVVKLANTEQEVVDLKSTVHDLKLMLKPSMQQTRRLFLDPAIHAEFSRMKKELEAADKRVKELQDDLAAVQFTPHSKHGKLLMAKCRTLQEENSEIGREASEGKVHELGTRLAVQKSLNSKLRRCYQELYDTVEDVNYELERSQQMVYNLQREVQKRDHQLAEVLKQNEEHQSRREEPTTTHEEEDHQQLVVKDGDK
uniref:FKBP12-interacting protein of 37 kDa n=3 Tax=Physcomitrium patens TaxID=3218 RepID=A9T7M0_PHYPA|nr:FKBP12-interacting protein of 37 kDa-like isoform X1 [Physcomitrium patens]PNR49466.1 hypothetical protein PHYPA_011362 [Physcomitrium patens]|eukprot:XP_024383527.1 FKBP12-interacting protein of 37 kDa-like isoform X1 [Physcomitrella patens]